MQVYYYGTIHGPSFRHAATTAQVTPCLPRCKEERTREISHTGGGVAFVIR